jgi:hypothetical protein
MFKARSLIISLVLSFSAAAAIAAKPPPEQPPEQTNEEKKKSLGAVIVEKNKDLSEKIDDVAKDVDLAIAGRKLVDVHNQTQIIIRNQVIWAEGGAVSYTPLLAVRLHLPNVEKKWQLRFSTDADEEEYRGVNRNRIKTAPIKRNYGGSVGVIQKLGNITAEFEPRIEYRDKAMVSYYLRLKSAATSPRLSLYPELHLFARADSGVGEFFAFNFDVPLSKKLVFSSINEEQYMDRERLFSTNNGVRLNYEFTERLSQGFSLMFESSNRPSYHLDRYTFATGIVYKLLNNVIHVGFVPYLAFARPLEFRGSPGLNLELNFIF